MKNLVIDSMMREFSDKNSLPHSLSESLLFEKFSAHSLFSGEYADSFSLDNVGAGECVGVDAVVIAINGVIVYTEEEAVELMRGRFDVTFNFLQAKTSVNMDLGDYLKFLNTVNIFFSEKKSSQPNDLMKYFSIKEKIYEKSTKHKSEPVLRLYYVYAGDNKNRNNDFSAQIDSKFNGIKNMPQKFNTIESSNEIIDAYGLASRYRESLNRVHKDLIFQKYIPLSGLSKATAAYLGVVGCLNYIDIITNESGRINKALFYDNVRDFLGRDNDVNKKLKTQSRAMCKGVYFPY